MLQNQGSYFFNLTNDDTIWKANTRLFQNQRGKSYGDSHQRLHVAYQVGFFFFSFAMRSYLPLFFYFLRHTACIGGEAKC